MTKVCVLMSTYNGEKYLKAQLDSILNQKKVEIILLVRDDGSIDSTRLILEEYQSKKLLRWFCGENLGPAKSFFYLLDIADKYDFYAFADQDDIWNENKLYYAVTEIEKTKGNCQTAGKGVLYFCNKSLVDENDNFLMEKHHVFNQKIQSCLLESFASGCCFVFDNSIRNMVLSHLPTCNVLHDRWMLLLSILFGQVIYDDRPLMHYRVHQNNAAGVSRDTIFSKIYFLFAQRKKGNVKAAILAKELLNQCGAKLDAEQSSVLKVVANSEKNVLARLQMFFSNDFVIPEKSINRKIYSKLKILMGKI